LVLAVITVKEDMIIMTVTAVPKSSRDSIVGLYGEAVKVAITAPPVDGKANAHICKFLAGEFKTAKSNVSIVKGETSKHKTVEIRNYRVIPDILKALVNDNDKS
jgi:hypothetical protein